MAGSHNHWLVLLSLIVAVTASFVALELATRVVAPYRRPAVRRYWLAGGAISMGIGIWSMHFIAMLGFELPIAVSYDIPVTALSLLIAVAAAGFALVVATRETLGVRRLVGAGALMGIAIAAMHYTGMAAMRMEPPIRYQPLLFSLSLLIAFGASVVALWSSFELRLETIATAFWKKAGSAVLMGGAIFGMHYTGMAAAQFAPGSVSLTSLRGFDPVWLAATLGASTLVFLTGTLLVAAFDSYVFFEELRQLSRRLVETQDAERRALAAELHDIVGQELSAVNAELALLRSQLPPGAPPEASERLANASALIKRSVDAVRNVMAQLRPPGLDELGLTAALRWHAAAFEGRAGVTVTVSADETLPRPSAKVEDAVLRIYLEALNNILKHAGAGKVLVSLAARDGQVVMGVADDGHGFDPERPVRRDAKSGWGLMIMKERALSVGGERRVQSAPGAGTRIEFVVSKDKWS